MQLHKKFGFPTINFNQEGTGGGGGGENNAAADSAPENILFPKEGEGNGAADQTQQPAGDWKEYVNDDSKSAEENAAAKAEHDKTKPAADDKAKNDPANKVPEDGKYSLTMPEGVEVDQELLDAVGADFKELNLTNGQAQKLADKFTSVMQARAENQGKVWGERVQKWADDAKADKTMGGDNWNGTVNDAQRAIAKLGTPELKEYLNSSGGGNHPEVIRILAKAGALLKEDNPPNGGGQGSGKPAEAAHLLFPNDAPKG